MLLKIHLIQTNITLCSKPKKDWTNENYHYFTKMLLFYLSCTGTRCMNIALSKFIQKPGLVKE